MVSCLKELWWGQKHKWITMRQVVNNPTTTVDYQNPFGGNCSRECTAMCNISNILDALPFVFCTVQFHTKLRMVWIMQWVEYIQLERSVCVCCRALQSAVWVRPGRAEGKSRWPPTDSCWAPGSSGRECWRQSRASRRNNLSIQSHTGFCGLPEEGSECIFSIFWD